MVKNRLLVLTHSKFLLSPIIVYGLLDGLLDRRWAAF